MSWLFVLAQQLKSFVLPIIALLIFGRRGDSTYELWGLVGVGALVLVSLWQYFTYRYGVIDDALVVRSGRLERSLRVIPFARIHNVALQQTLLHRLFGVAEVRLESAGGQKPEAEMRVLKLDDALALEALIRRRGRAAEPGAEAGEPQAPPLLALPPGELVRLGLISNRGMVVVAAAAAAMTQFGPGDALENYLERQAEQDLRLAAGWADNHHLGPAEYAVGAIALLLALLVLVRLLSVALSLLQFYGFTLSEQGRRLTVERGLLARWRTSASRRRIQAWTLREGLLHRLFRRRSLDVDTAVSENGQQQRALRELAPVATPATCDALIDHLLPKAGWTSLSWQPVPGVAWWRLFLPGLPVTLVLAAIAYWRFGPWGLLVLLWLPWAAFKARQRARRIGYAVSDELVAVREGWWSRHWRFAEIDKLQALRLVRTPLDRHFGTAMLKLDTAGAGAMAPPLRIRFLPEDDARALYERLARALARRPLRW
ncbi:PH domain-containing protein [Marilutibacter chinensis]|uniref:PH domain-containing protein n=1 Tax=Marilutibacter chinensis TaxID=2912247 RepID=A0ABS9HTZ0_9GAMM|nr:PH domain-containing protein [Lysobacter chinensis]MCF7221557.1 PH domain-containing protein [Lysobacter chinensis]